MNAEISLKIENLLEEISILYTMSLLGLEPFYQQLLDDLSDRRYN